MSRGECSAFEIDRLRGALPVLVLNAGERSSRNEVPAQYEGGGSFHRSYEQGSSAVVSKAGQCVFSILLGCFRQMKIFRLTARGPPERRASSSAAALQTGWLRVSSVPQHSRKGFGS